MYGIIIVYLHWVDFHGKRIGNTTYMDAMGNTLGGRNPANQLSLVVYPFFSRLLSSHVVSRIFSNQPYVAPKSSKVSHWLSQYKS